MATGPFYNMSGSDADLLEALTTQPRSTTYANSLRCGTLINELLKQPSVVSHVYHSRRHLILVYNDQKSLVAFDNVPQWAHPERLDTNAILQSLLSDAPSPPHMLSTRQNSRILHVELDPSMLLLRLTSLRRNGSSHFLTFWPVFWYLCPR